MGEPQENKPKTEKCIRCGKDTEIPINCHVDDPRRNGHYIEGAGQPCDYCHEEIYRGIK